MRVSVLLGILLATGCAAPSGTDVDTPATGAIEGEVVVQAAASLTDVLEDVAAAFTAAHPDASVTVNAAGSQTLATQILQGAPADVFASADERQMDRVATEGLLAGDPQIVATADLAIAVEAGNPFGIAGLSDLADPALVVVMAAPDVPAGALAAQALAAADVQLAPASLESDVRSVLAKVRLGEADAGIVYATDVQAADGAVDGIALPDGPTARYPIAVMADAPNPRAAEALVDLVLSDTGQAILADHGFGTP